MIEIIKLDKDVYFDPYTSCIYFDTILNDEERQDIRNKITNKMNMKKTSLINDKKHILNNLTLIPTMQCQGNCLYCYNKNNNNLISDYLTVDVLKQKINFLKANGYEFNVNTLNLYGGEPFLNENIVDLISFIFNNNLTTDSAIVNISSSLLYDDNTFNRVIKQCKQLQDKKIPFYVSVAIDFGTNKDNYTRLSIKNIEIDKQILIERANILYQNNISIKLSSIISSLTNIESLENEVKQHYDTYIKSDTNNYLKLNVFDKFAYRFSAVHNDYLFLTNQKIDELFDFISRNKYSLPITQNMFPYLDIMNTADIIKLSDKVFLFLYQPTYCGIYSRSIVIMPDGNLSPCHMDPYNTNICIQQNTKEYSTLFNNLKCNECDYYLMCRSGCININKATSNVQALNSYCYYLKKCINFSMQNCYNIFLDKKEYFNFLNKNSR